MLEGFEDFMNVGIEHTDNYTMPNNIVWKIANYKKSRCQS